MEVAIGLAAVIAIVIWLAIRSSGKRPEAGHGPAPEPAAPNELREQWAAMLDRDDILILDTETTGLSDRAEIVEIVAIDTRGAIRVEALTMPVGRIPREASDVHGLTRAQLKREGARAWPEIHAEVVSVLASAKIILAWNASYDRRLLMQTAARHELAMPELPWLDLLAEYRTIRPGGRHRLTDAAAREAVEPGTAHRALGDCRAILAVMRAVAGEGAAGGRNSSMNGDGIAALARDRRCRTRQSGRGAEAILNEQEPST